MLVAYERDRNIKFTSSITFRHITNNYSLHFFDVCKSVHHHTIQINQPTRCSSFTSLLPGVYVWLNMFRAPLRPSSGAYNCTRSLWFYRWSVAVGAFLVVVWQVMRKRSFFLFVLVFILGATPQIYESAKY
jgi:hypothetical protein